MTQKPTDDFVWTIWCEFCDRAEVAPDTELSAEELARRFNHKTGGMISPKRVEEIMPENQR